MNFIRLRKNSLCVENVTTFTLVKKYKTPFYCYSLSQLQNNFYAFASAFKTVNPIICFSVKSNSNLNLLVVSAHHKHCHRLRLQFQTGKPVANRTSFICVPPARRMSCILVFKIKDRRAASGPGYSAISRPVLVLHDGTARSRLRIDGPRRNMCVVRCHKKDWCSWRDTAHETPV